MIGMAEDAYKLKNLDDIMDYDTELMYEKKPIYNSEQGLIYKDGKIYTTDYSEDESEIILRDIEGVIKDKICYYNGKDNDNVKTDRTNRYHNWNYSSGN